MYDTGWRLGQDLIVSIHLTKIAPLNSGDVLKPVADAISGSEVWRRAVAVNRARQSFSRRGGLGGPIRKARVGVSFDSSK